MVGHHVLSLAALLIIILSLAFIATFDLTFLLLLIFVVIKEHSLVAWLSLSRSCSFKDVTILHSLEYLLFLGASDLLRRFFLIGCSGSRFLFILKILVCSLHWRLLGVAGISLKWFGRDRWLLGLLLCIRVMVGFVGLYHNARHGRTVLPLGKLVFVGRYVLALKLSHLLDLVKVYYEALLICMIYLNTLSAEYSLVVGAIEMHDPLVMWLAQFVLKCLRVILILIEIDLTKERVPLYYLIKYVNIQRKSLRGFQVFYELFADGTPDAEISKKSRR